MRRLLAILCAMTLAFLGALAETEDPARAEGLRSVSIELVLAVDVSLSVDDVEFALQMQGLAEAFRRREIIDLIAQHQGGVAVVLVQWSGVAETVAQWDDPDAADTLEPWRLLSDAASVRAFADEVAAAPRATLGYYTGIGTAIDYSVRLIETNGFAGRQRKIDVSGDGFNNTPPEPAAARARALGRGITINGLAILNNEPDLQAYYADAVAGGSASFVMSAKDYSDFAEAMAKKLFRELTIFTAIGPPHRRVRQVVGYRGGE